jgi:DNA-binding transcriptional ArsR family regulator/uncharacterized protein YndB with AHSA1/START domain
MTDDATGTVWRALADASRRRILDLLRDRPRTTGEIASEFPDVSRFAVMKHLGVLEQTGLVVVRRRGRERWNHLNAVPLRHAYERWMQPYADEWASSLLRLKEHTEEKGKQMGDMGSMEVEVEVTIEAPREQVFDALVNHVGDWWGHTVEDGKVVLEPWVGGRFFEESGDGEGFFFGKVTALKAPELLRITGPYGMTGAVVGVAETRLRADGKRTVVEVTHRAWGDVDEAAQKSYSEGWRALYEQALGGWLAKAG